MLPLLPEHLTRIIDIAANDGHFHKRYFNAKYSTNISMIAEHLQEGQDANELSPEDQDLLIALNKTIAHIKTL